MNFESLIARVRIQIGKLSVSEVLKFIFEHSGLEIEYLKDKEDGMDRVQNVKELVSLATKYDEEISEDALFKFIEDVSLYSDQDEISDEVDAIRLMTIHASKGLEFDYVFIVGLEQGLFPSENFDTNKDDEEERRLFYVALTRACKKIYLTYAGMRKMYGSLMVNTPSEFLLDIPEAYVEIYGDEPRYGGNDDEPDTSSLAKSIFIDFWLLKKYYLIMNFESNIVSEEIVKDNSFEKIKVDISKKIEAAISNPLKTSRYIELDDTVKSQQQKFFKLGSKSPEDLELDNQITGEILKSGAIVETLPEYKELLNQVSKKFNLGEEWENDLIAHENAHANVSEELKYEQVGYGTFFLSNDEGVLESIQPAHVHIEPNSWSPIEVIENGIKTLEAPKEYNNEMSEADISERDQLISQREEIRKKELDEVRQRLGI